jgi:hypothetical protein
MLIDAETIEDLRARIADQTPIRDQQIVGISGQKIPLE